MPSFNYEHVDVCTRCTMGREFSVFQMSLDPRKICDNCSGQIRIREIPKTTFTDVKSANITGKVSEDPLVNAAYTYGPSGPSKLPPPMTHPTPGNPVPGPPGTKPTPPHPLTD